MKINAKKLIYFQLLFVLFQGILTSQFGLPDSIKFITDICNIGILVLGYKKICKNVQMSALKVSLTIIVLYAIYSVLSAIIGLVSSNIVLALWGLRNTFRLYVFFVSCIAILDIEDIHKIIKLLKNVYIINFAIVLIQYFALGYKMDYLGGIFGVQQGCNGPLNLFVVIVLVICFIDYIEKKINVFTMGSYVIMAFVIAGFAELKVLYVEIVFMAIVVTLISKPSFKTVFFFLFIGGGIWLGINILESVFPDAYSVLVNYKDIRNYLSSSWFGYLEVTRLTAFTVINDMFFKDNVFREMFGMGLGTCDWTSFASSKFANKYGYMNYKNFTFSMKYLETGMVGLILYCIFFVSIWFSTLVKRRNKKTYIEKIILLLIPMALFNVWYNDSCSSEIGYLLYLLIAILGVERVQCSCGVNRLENNNG